MTGQPNAELKRISAALSTSFHVLVATLSVIVVLNAGGPGTVRTVATVAMTALFVATYVAGIWPRGALPQPDRRGLRWIVALTAEWLVLLTLSAEATYLVFALFLCFMWLLGAVRGTAAVAASTAVAVLGFGLHRGFSIAGVIGPVLGAGVAVVIGLGYQTLTREVLRRQQLIEQLTRTRAQLATAERAAGVADERERLAREIHDTVSQSLSSIIMLLHAAQRADGAAASPGWEHVEQARQAASDALAETREFIHALAPPSLRTGGIDAALTRLADQTQDATGIRVEVTLPDTQTSLPTPVEAALLRIAQSAMANVTQHANASRVDLTLSRLDDEIILDVVDDGVGFDLTTLNARSGGDPSFGLLAMQDRVNDLGGTLVVESSLGHGTSVAASFTAAR